jgi:hypothetical protein
MNKAEIEDIFIKAAFIDSRLPDNAKPKRLKGQWIGGSLLTTQDMMKWITREKTDVGRNQLRKGDDPIKDWWLQFWDDRSTDTSRKDIGLWEMSMELMILVADEGNRRALWAWANAKVDNLSAHQKATRQTKAGKDGTLPAMTLKAHKRTRRGVSFAAWCKSEGIHEMTGSRRKDRAIAIILQHLVRGRSSNVESGEFGVLPVGPVFEHICDMIGAGSESEEGLRSIMDDTAFSPIGVLEARDFSWAEARNEQRRQREAERREKRKAAA